MKSSVLKGVPEDMHQEIRGEFIASRQLRLQLQKIIQSKIDEQFKAQYSRKGYEKASWAVFQADAMGYCRALTQIKALLDGKQEVEPEKRGKGRPKKSVQFPTPLN